MVWIDRNRTTKNNERSCNLKGNDRRHLEQPRHLAEELFDRSLSNVAHTTTIGLVQTCHNFL